MIEVDGGDPAFEDPTKPIGPIYDPAEAQALAKQKGWSFDQTATAFVGSCPHQRRSGSSGCRHCAGCSNTAR